MKKSPSPQSVMRSRTVVIGSTKGGVNKTSLAANLAHEAARLGLRVLLVDVDGGGGMSSLAAAYAPRGMASITDVISGDAGLTYYPVERWTPDGDQPWYEGGPAIEGGSIAILPAAASAEGQRTVSDVVSEGGATNEVRLAHALNHPALHENIDIVFLDMPGTDNRAVISTILHAAEHFAFPIYPKFFAYEALNVTDSKIDEWVDAMGKPINYLGGIPTSIPTRLSPGSPERRVLLRQSRWIERNSEGQVHILAPGIEQRGIVLRAETQSLPITSLSRTKQERRDQGNIPPALSRTLLTILDSMRPDPHDPETAERMDYDVEGMKQQLLSQDMPDEWRRIIDGPAYLPVDHWGNRFELDEDDPEYPYIPEVDPVEAETDPSAATGNEDH